MNLTVTEPPSRTYKMDYERYGVRGYADGIEAVEQAVYKMLSTERYKHIIYSWNYGVELDDLFGQPITFVLPEIERRITECLTQDSRINSVDGFTFDIRRGFVHTSFTVRSVFGDFISDFTFNTAVNV